MMTDFCFHGQACKTFLCQYRHEPSKTNYNGPETIKHNKSEEAIDDPKLVDKDTNDDLVQDMSESINQKTKSLEKANTKIRDLKENKKFLESKLTQYTEALRGFIAKEKKDNKGKM